MRSKQTTCLHGRAGSEAGFSMASTLVTITLGTAMIYAVSTSLSKSTKLARTISNVQDETSLKQQLKQKISCSRTIPTPRCAGSYVLRDKNGAVIPNPMGIYDLRASCDPTAPELKVDFRSVKPDPMTGKRLNWKSAFPTGLGFCTPEITGTAPSACPSPKVVLGVNTDGTAICGDMPAVNNANTANTANFARTITGGACPPGTVMTGINTNGTPLCGEAPPATLPPGSTAGLCVYWHNRSTCDQVCIPPMGCNKTCPAGFRWIHVAARYEGMNEKWVGTCMKQ